MTSPRTSARATLLKMIDDAARGSVEERTEWIEQIFALAFAMNAEQRKADPAGAERIAATALGHIRSAFPIVPLIPDDISGGCAA